MSDTEFFREVEEEVRREKLKKFWDQYGPYLIGGAVGVVAIVAGFKGWEAWQKDRTESAGAKYVAAELLASDGKNADARIAFEKLVAEGPGGYPMLARLRLAGAEAADGKKDEAVAAYDRIAKDGSVDRLLRGFAQVQAAVLRVDDADFTEITSRIGDLANSDGTWRNTAREILGLSAYKNKLFDKANVHYTEIIGDQTAPPRLRERAEMMISLIAGLSAPKAADTEAKGEEPADKK